MSARIGIAARLVFRVGPLPLESARGYLCRVAQANSYHGPLSLVHLAGLRVADLKRLSGVRQIAHLLRLEPQEWAFMCYRHIKGPGPFEERLFYDQPVRADQFNYGRPRVCPHCLREQPVWWAVWDLGLVAACPRHGCILVNKCPACGRKFVSSAARSRRMPLRRGPPRNNRRDGASGRGGHGCSDLSRCRFPSGARG